jgi:hypothetical protein
VGWDPKNLVASSSRSEWITTLGYLDFQMSGALGDERLGDSRDTAEAQEEQPQSQEPLPPCTSSVNFNFNQFADQVEENRFDLGATLGTLVATEAIGTMPKTPSELRGLGVPKSELNPFTSQLSRWADRFDMRPLRTFGRSALGVGLSAAATVGTVFEGFYDIGTIGKAAWDATSRKGCMP